MRRSPFTCHFCVSQFGSQLLFMKRVKLPFGPASIILNSHINILFVLTHHSLWTIVPYYRTFYFAISHCDTINQRIQQQLQTSLGISHSKSWTHQKSLTIHTHTHPFNGPLSGTTRVSRYQKGKTNLDFTEARDSEWQWHKLGHMQVCTSLQTDNHASIPPLCFLQARCPSCCPTNSVKALKPN